MYIKITCGGSLPSCYTVSGVTDHTIAFLTQGAPFSGCLVKTVLWSVGLWLGEECSFIASSSRAAEGLNPALPSLMPLVHVVCTLRQKSGDCNVLSPLKFLLDGSSISRKAKPFFFFFLQKQCSNNIPEVVVTWANQD